MSDLDSDSEVQVTYYNTHSPFPQFPLFRYVKSLNTGPPCIELTPHLCGCSSVILVTGIHGNDDWRKRQVSHDHEIIKLNRWRRSLDCRLSNKVEGSDGSNASSKRKKTGDVVDWEGDVGDSGVGVCQSTWTSRRCFFETTSSCAMFKSRLTTRLFRLCLNLGSLYLDIRAVWSSDGAKKSDNGSRWVQR